MSLRTTSLCVFSVLVLLGPSAVVLPPPTAAAAQRCSPDCGEHGMCRRGKCWCEKGWTGPTCDREGDNPCDMGCFGNGRCDPETLVCTCNEGWKGIYCGHPAQRPERKRKAGGKDPGRSAKVARGMRAEESCPPELVELPWWERYGVPPGADATAVRKRLSACENKPDPVLCVETMVKLGEVRAPEIPACAFARR
jgi:hypothetical protein